MNKNKSITLTLGVVLDVFNNSKETERVKLLCSSKILRQQCRDHLKHLSWLEIAILAKEWNTDVILKLLEYAPEYMTSLLYDDDKIFNIHYEPKVPEKIMELLINNPDLESRFFFYDFLLHIMKDSYLQKYFYDTDVYKEFLSKVAFIGLHGKIPRSIQKIVVDNFDKEEFANEFEMDEDFQFKLLEKINFTQIAPFTIIDSINNFVIDKNDWEKIKTSSVVGEEYFNNCLRDLYQQKRITLKVFKSLFSGPVGQLSLETI